jgi:hypothetical protein
VIPSFVEEFRDFHQHNGTCSDTLKVEDRQMKFISADVRHRSSFTAKPRHKVLQEKALVGKRRPINPKYLVLKRAGSS